MDQNRAERGQFRADFGTGRQPILALAEAKEQFTRTESAAALDSSASNIRLTN